MSGKVTKSASVVCNDPGQSNVLAADAVRSFFFTFFFKFDPFLRLYIGNASNQRVRIVDIANYAYWLSKQCYANSR